MGFKANGELFSAQPYELPPGKLAQAKVLGKIRPLLHFGEELWEVAFLALLLATGAASRLAEWAIAEKFRKSWLQSLHLLGDFG